MGRLPMLIRRAHWPMASPARGGGEREVAKSARKVTPQVLIGVGAARLIRIDRNEDLSVHSSRKQPQQSAGMVHRRLGHPRVESPHGEVVGVGAVWPVGGRAERTEVG